MGVKYKTARLNGRKDYVHRQVAAATLGRALRPGEQVHHVNGDTLDNRPENLEVVASQREHSQKHHRAQCKRGHDLTDESNIYYRPDNGRRTCYPCDLARQRERYARRKESANVRV